MTEPAGVFIDPPPFIHLEIHSTVALKQAEADACKHAQVDFSKPVRETGVHHVDVVCLGCGHEWAQVRVHDVVRP